MLLTGAPAPPLPSQVEGNLIKWERWHIRTSFNYREGLVLHNVCYEDEGRLRPILHRASLVEMAVVRMAPVPVGWLHRQLMSCRAMCLAPCLWPCTLPPCGQWCTWARGFVANPKHSLFSAGQPCACCSSDSGGMQHR